MVIPIRSKSICQRCRYDLQSLFELGFCNNTTLRKARPLQFAQRSLLKSQRHQFSHTTKRFSSFGRTDVSTGEINDQRELSEDDTALAAQIEAIEQLEKELGKPLEQAIKDDEDRAESIIRYQSHHESAEHEDAGLDPVTLLRNTGASPDDIVRAARQTHGDVLPNDTLNPEELLLYRRLYGEPVDNENKQDSSQILDPPDSDVSTQNRLFSAVGEEIEFQPYDRTTDLSEPQREAQVPSELDTGDVQLQLRDLALSLGGSVVESDESDDVEDDEEYLGIDRGHPLTSMGKFGTTPKTVYLSRDGFVKPVEKIMSKYSNKHLKDMCEKTFGGPGLPDSPLTPRSGRSRQQVSIPLDANQNTMGEMEANAFISAVMPPTYASITSVLVETRKRLGPTWLNSLLAREGGPRVLDAGAGGAGIIAWREFVQAHWDTLHSSERKPPAPATRSVVLTGSDGLRHRSAAMLENTTFVPRLPDYVHTRDVATLQDDRPLQQRKKFDVIIAPYTLLGLKEDWMRKQYVQNLWTMLSDEAGILILIEKGMPRGFEAIAGAREMLLDRHIAVPVGQTTHYSKNQALHLDDDSIQPKQTAMIVAPCTNHERCPMYTAPGLSRGRKDICSFQQRYIRPPFLQRVLGAKDRNHDDVDFSYLSVMKGDDLRLRSFTSWEQVTDPLSAPRRSPSPEVDEAREALIAESKYGFEWLQVEPGIGNRGNAESVYEELPVFTELPRMVFPPLKRRGHVSMDVCTPAGKIERWTIPRSFSRQAYRDARKSKWGDVWALGAKTHISRTLRLGTPEKQLIGKDGEVIRGKGRGRKERLKMKAMQILEEHEEQKMDELMEQRDMFAALDEELGLDTNEPQDLDSAPAPAKPMNNRERKAARRAAREAQRSTRASGHEASDADLTFKPRPKPKGLSQRQLSVDDDSLAAEHAMAEWEAEFVAAARPGRGKKDGAFSKVGGSSSSKAAKRLQHGRNPDE